jgi:hypothetical protein
MRDNPVQTKSTARLATLSVLRETILPLFIAPVPTNETLRAIFDRENIPRLKTNALASRGGGPVYYSVAHVEKYFRSRVMGKAVHP